MTEELKPCPFCGASAQVAEMPRGFRNYFALECAMCSGEGPPGKTSAEAIAAWNRRAPVVVTPEMTKRALDAQPYADENDPIRAWQMLEVGDVDDKERLAKAMITAALEPGE